MKIKILFVNDEKLITTTGSVVVLSLENIYFPRCPKCSIGSYVIIDPHSESNFSSYFDEEPLYFPLGELKNRRSVVKIIREEKFLKIFSEQTQQRLALRRDDKVVFLKEDTLRYSYWYSVINNVCSLSCQGFQKLIDTSLTNNIINYSEYYFFKELIVANEF